MQVDFATQRTNSHCRFRSIPNLDFALHQMGRREFAFRVFEFIWAVSSGDCTTLRDWSSFAWSCEGSQKRLNIWTCASTHESRQAGAPELDTDWRITPIGGERDQTLREIGAEFQTANGLLFSVLDRVCTAGWR